MKTYILTVDSPEGAVELTFRCDYDFGEALKVYEYVGGLIGIKPSKGAIKWYVGGIRADTVAIWREETPYAGSVD